MRSGLIEELNVFCNHPMQMPFGRNLGDRLLFLQEFEHHFGFECVRIAFSRGGILPPYLARLLCPNSGVHYRLLSGCANRPMAAS